MLYRNPRYFEYVFPHQKRSTTQRARDLVSHFCLVAASLLLWIASTPSVWAQSTDRVFGPVDRNAKVTMRDHHPSWATPQNDVGAVPSDLAFKHLTLIFARSPEAQQAFEQFLASQQDPASSDYHHWLTPTEIGERFGVSLHDIAAVVEWLQSQSLKVDSASDSRVRITFSGSASAVGKAFGSEMHYFKVNGKQRTSITAAPQIPAALASVIKAIHGLYTVEYYPLHKSAVGYFSTNSAQPNFTLSNGSHFIAPADFATIYDLNPAYNSSINGAGQAIAIIGEARVYNPDIENFQSLSGLATKDPTVIVPPNGVDPGPAASSGSAPGAQVEATLDVTRSGSIAPGATILLVVSAPSGGGIVTATEYVVDATPIPAQVMNISFGGCESSAGRAGVTLWDSLFSQAAAEGISTFVSSGDAGAAGCDNHNQPPPPSQILSPNYICSSSYATCVGGTEFADTANPSQYWSSSNGPGLKSALSYIPEGAWNDPLNSSNATQLAASGGGVSAFIPTPSWQIGTGVPAARAGRYTPDVAFSSSGHDGYFGCLAAGNAGCVVQNGGFGFVSFRGTSAAAPNMAGIAALLNQKQGGPQGNLNPVLYELAAIPSNNVFHDVTVASSGVSNCSATIPSMCNNSTPSPTGLIGGLAGYLVGKGYDEVTGLGSLDVANFLASLSSVARSSTTTSLTASPNPAIFGSSVTFTATVTTAGSTPPSGVVTFQDSMIQLGSGTLNAVGVATFTTSGLTIGTHSITAGYAGDTHNLDSISTVLTETIESDWTLTAASTNPSSGVAITVSPSDNNGQGSGTTQFVRHYNNGVLVSLGAAISAGGNNFSSWTGCDAVSGTTCTLTMNANRSVSANYGGAQPALQFVPLAPCRIADTRNPNGPFGGPAISARSARSFAIPNSSSCNVPLSAAAYSLNVTAVPDTGFLGYLTIWPTGQPQPFVSTLNSVDGRVKANAAIVPAGTGGAISVYVTDATDVVLDINGYFVLAAGNSSALAFFALPPCRVADTRNTSGPLGGPSLVAQQARSFPVLSSTCSIPSTAQAYSLNFTAVPHNGFLGYLTTWPTGMAQPWVSTLNATTGVVTANAAIVPAGPGGAISVYVTDAADLVIDTNGYFAPSTAGTDLALYTLPPCRVLDTRQTTGVFLGTLTDDTTASPCRVIPSAQAVVLNATVVPTQGFLGYLTLWPSGQSQPFVSTLNAVDGLVTSNMAIVPTTSGLIDAYATDPTQLILDTIGYFASGTAP